MAALIAIKGIPCGKVQSQQDIELLSPFADRHASGRALAKVLARQPPWF
jgi:hypothetical protein